MSKSIEMICEDCFNVMKMMKSQSVDLILTDPPYNMTGHKWDKRINLSSLWHHYERIIKDDGIIAIFTSQPFTSLLISSNLELYRYNWIWMKNSPTGFLNCNYAPLKLYEEVCIFSKGKVGSLAKNPIRYFPQGVKEVNIEKHGSPNSKFRSSMGYPAFSNSLNKNNPFFQKYTNYPRNILEFDRDKCEFHPMQKPIALLEYLISTYTRENECVLDNFAGSFSCAIACLNLNRKFIGIEYDKKYYDMGIKRIEQNKQEK
jgi:site-specific DNA-methyltransferase (adenine-specific)